MSHSAPVYEWHGHRYPTDSEQTQTMNQTQTQPQTNIKFGGYQFPVVASVNGGTIFKRCDTPEALGRAYAGSSTDCGECVQTGREYAIFRRPLRECIATGASEAEAWQDAARAAIEDEKVVVYDARIIQEQIDGGTLGSIKREMFARLLGMLGFFLGTDLGSKYVNAALDNPTAFVRKVADNGLLGEDEVNLYATPYGGYFAIMNNRYFDVGDFEELGAYNLAQAAEVVRRKIGTWVRDEDSNTLADASKEANQ